MRKREEIQSIVGKVILRVRKKSRTLRKHLLNS